MIVAPHQITLAGFVLLMLIAAFEDFRRFVIPNALTLALCALWPIHAAVAGSLSAALAALGCAAAVFIVGALLFSRGYLGGGDVKLLSVATLWAGSAGTPALLALTGVLGGALALFLLMPLGAHLAAWGRSLLGQSAEPVVTGRAAPVPYGVAIAGAALITALSPNFI